MADFGVRIVTMVLTLGTAAAAVVVVVVHFSPRAAWVWAGTAVYVRLIARRTWLTSLL